MRGRSSKQVNEVGLEAEQVKEEPHVSGAYIRTLVKQLTSSRTKDPLNSKDVDDLVGDGGISCQTRNSAKPGDSYNIAPPLTQESLNFPLPNQTLGLNLNLHDFNNLDTTPYFSNNNPPIYPSYSYFPIEDIHCTGLSGVCPMVDKVNTGLINEPDSGLYPVMDDKEMAEMRSIGEQHQMEWNDTLNFVTSAWWFKFLKTMEIGPGEEQNGEDYGCYPFHEVMEFPAWLNANESCLSDTYSDGYLQDPGLPWIDPLGRRIRNRKVRQLVPYAAAGIAEAMQRCAAGLHVTVPQPHVGLQLVQNHLAGRVDAEVVEGQLVVRYVPEGAVVGGFVSPNNVLEAVLGAAVVTAAVGEEQGGAAHAEEAVRDQHRAVLTGVPIKAHHFGANHQSIVIRVSLEHVTGQIQRYDPRAAPHSAEVEAQNISPQLVVVNNHGGERGRGVENAAVHH
nr:myb-like protein P [Ipomoea batatas]